MIPRHQTILLVLLVLASLGMGGLLYHMREKAHQQLLAGQDSAPTKAPEVASPVQATLMVANDDDNSILTQVHLLPLPSDPGARARAVLAKLLEIYAAPDATHPVAGGPSGVAQVFLLPAQDPNTNSADRSSAKGTANGPEMAVVNLTGTFVASHPSGLETETLTVLSICGTLHANLPRVTQVRFLVDGEQRPTLAGHADLTRTYLVSDAPDTSPAAGAQP